MQRRIQQYIERWIKQGYPDGIPDEVPDQLMQLQLAPSYKAIALAILKHDHACLSLGFSAPYSPWYNELKRIEIEARPKQGESFEKSMEL